MDEATLNFGQDLNNIYRAIMGKIWTKIGHNSAELASFFKRCFSMELSAKKHIKHINSISFCKERFKVQRSAPFISWETWDLRLEFVSEFSLEPLWSSSQYFVGNWSKSRAIMGKICTKIKWKSAKIWMESNQKIGWKL